MNYLTNTSNFLQLLFDISYGNEFKNAILDSENFNNVNIEQRIT